MLLLGIFFGFVNGGFGRVFPGGRLSGEFRASIGLELALFGSNLGYSGVTNPLEASLGFTGHAGSSLVSAGRRRLCRDREIELQAERMPSLHHRFGRRGGGQAVRSLDRRAVIGGNRPCPAETLFPSGA